MHSFGIVLRQKLVPRYPLQSLVGFVLIVVATLPCAASAQTNFRRVQLPYGVSIDVPSHWTVLSQDTHKNLGTAGESMVDNAGVDKSSGRKEALLAVNATPNPTGAMIRVSIVSPPDYTQADLAAATPKDLKAVAAELKKLFKKLEASGGPKVTEVQPARIEKVGNYRALIMSYVRADARGPAQWQVTQYKIPIANRLIEMTLSHRLSDAAVWQPILERVKRSLHF